MNETSAVKPVDNDKKREIKVKFNLNRQESDSVEAELAKNNKLKSLNENQISELKPTKGLLIKTKHNDVPMLVAAKVVALNGAKK